jgi:hypothetical protein
VFDAIRLVPVDAGSGDPVPVADDDGGGCSAGGSPGWLLAALILCRLRRRSFAR